MKKQIVAGAATVLAAAAALAGCSSDKSSTDSGTITIMAPFLSAQAPAANNPIGKRLEQITGKKMKITWVPNSSYGDKTNITLAGDNIPKVMVIQGKSAGFVKSAEAGGFWDLTDQLKKYPNLVTTDPRVQKSSSVNGKVYGIYRARDSMRTAVSIRKDWLEHLGLSRPRTVQDLYNLAKAFTDDDPDGNGKKDTYGIVIPKWPGGLGTNSPYDAIEAWFGAGNLWVEKGGKLIPSFTTDQFVEADKFIRKMLQEGLINKDFATMDSENWNQPFFNGKAGIIIDVYSRVNALRSLFEEKYPKDYQKYVTFAGNLAGPDGQLRALPTDGYSGFLAVPKASVPTQKDLDAVLSFLNKLNSKEAQIVMNNGIQGKSFTVQNGLAVVKNDTPQAKTLGDTVASYAQLGMNVAGYHAYEVKQPNAFDQQQYDEEQTQMTADLKKAVFNPASPYVSKTYIARGAQLDNIIADARIKFIAGQIDEQGFRAAIKTWRSSGGDQVISEINQLYSKDN